MNIGIIIQARVGSSRLPRKVMLPLPLPKSQPEAHGTSANILQWVVDRCTQVPIFVDGRGLHSMNFMVIVATTVLQEDDEIVDLICNYSKGRDASAVEVRTFRGSSEDVLGRYYLAAQEHNLDIVIRVTSDCPFIDPELIAEGVVQFCEASKGIDYLSNNLTRDFPHGLDYEIMTYNALKIAYNSATTVSDREHVTAYIRESEKFSLGQVAPSEPTARSLQCAEELGYHPGGIRITIDTYEDYLLLLVCVDMLNMADGTIIRKHTPHYVGQNVNLKSLLELFVKYPYLRGINLINSH